ncbi:MAG: hypothetical protein M1269_07900 [Chloroflexi bacterium]|nr:hypothetical protein [Chloroflexota bacterium]
MNLEPLVEVITREVMERLSALDSTPAGEPPDPSKKQKSTVILLPHEMQEEAPFWKSLGTLDGIQHNFLVSHPAQKQDLARFLPGVPFRAHDPETPLAPLVESGDFLLFPFFTLECLARAATLTGGDRVSDALLMGLRKQKPLLVDLAELSDMNRLSAYLPRGFLETVAGHLRTLASFKVIPLEVNSLSEQLKGGAGAVNASAGRSVLTREDVLKLMDAGGKDIRMPMGSIITPLARDLCDENGIALIFY